MPCPHSASLNGSPAVLQTAVPSTPGVTADCFAAGDHDMAKALLPELALLFRLDQHVYQRERDEQNLEL